MRKEENPREKPSVFVGGSLAPYPSTPKKNMGWWNLPSEKYAKVNMGENLPQFSGWKQNRFETTHQACFNRLTGVHFFHVDKGHSGKEKQGSFFQAPSPKLTCSPLKGLNSKRKRLSSNFQPSIFRCELLVSGRGIDKKHLNNTFSELWLQHSHVQSSSVNLTSKNVVTVSVESRPSDAFWGGWKDEKSILLLKEEIPHHLLVMNTKVKRAKSSSKNPPRMKRWMLSKDVKVEPGWQRLWL